MEQRVLATTRSSSAAARAAKFVIGLVVTAVFVWLLFGNVSLTDLAGAIASADLRFVPAGLACLVIGYAARITRWWLMLRAGDTISAQADEPLSWRAAATPFLTSIAVNNVAPLRAGDVLRVFAFRGRADLGPARVLGTLVVERVLDLCTLLVILFVVLQFVPDGRVPSSIARTAAIVAGVGAVAALGLLIGPAVGGRMVRALQRIAAVQSVPFAPKLLAFAAGLCDSMRAILGGGRRVILYFALTGVAWAFEGGVFLAAAFAIHLAENVAAASYFALAAATLATLLPSSPGYVGTFHFFAAEAVAAFGAPAATAAGFAVLAHSLLWLTTTIGGFLAFAAAALSRINRPALAQPPNRPLSPQGLPTDA